MKILGSEKQRYENSTFLVFVVDILDSETTFNVTVKNSYKKRVFTNGTLERLSVNKPFTYFKVVDGDWLVIIDEHDNISVYVTEQYCGPIKVKDREVQATISEFYTCCRERIASKRNFAKEMGAISVRLNLPFQVVMAFKGNEEALTQIVQNIENAIKNHIYEDENFMSALSGECLEARMSAIATFGIVSIPDYQSEKIAKYLHQCLEKKKVIGRYQ